MKKPRDVIQPRSGVYALRKRAEKLGAVEVKDQKDALDRTSGECMSEIAEYRRYAQICGENAERAPSEGDRRALLNLARDWLQLASEVQPATPDTLAQYRAMGAGKDVISSGHALAPPTAAPHVE